MPGNPPIVVTGAGGRAGRAIVGEATRRGIPVVAVVRDPARAADLNRDGVRVASGNALLAHRLTPGTLHLDAHEPPQAWVTAVAPSPDRPDDVDFYATIARNTLATMRATGTQRLVSVGLFATLRTPDGIVLDDPGLFPPELKPFAQAHLTGLETLRKEGDDVDWIVLAPPPLLTADAVSTGHYRLGDDALTGDERQLSYDDLAVAVLDEIERPTRHRELVAVSAPTAKTQVS